MFACFTTVEVTYFHSETMQSDCRHNESSCTESGILVPWGNHSVVHVQHLMLDKFAFFVSEQWATIIRKAAKFMQLADFVFDGVAGTLFGGRRGAGSS